MTEEIIQSSIRVALSGYAVLFRVNVGKWKTIDGRWVSTGVPVGFSDLCGFRKSDGKALFIEVKKPGGRIAPAQRHFIDTMKSSGALSGIAYSVEDALEIIGATKGGNTL